MAKLFISYSRDDKTCVTDMVADLQSLGHEVWIDSELVGGQSWWDRILQEIQECDFFLIALSSTFLKSEACESEFSYASALGKTVLPVKIADNFNDSLLPSHIGRLQITDFDGGSKRGVLALIRAIDAAPKSPALAESLPEPPSIPVSYLAELLETINSNETLDYDQQAALLFKLRNHYNATGEAPGVLQALNQLDSRRDLLSSIGKELSKLQDEVQQKQRTSQPPPPSRNSTNTPDRKPPEPAIPTQATKPSNKPDALTYGLSLASLILPILGIVMFFVWRKEKPTSAKWVVWAAGLGVILYLLFEGMAYDPYYYY